MVQILEKVPTFGEEFGRAIGEGASEGLESGMAQKRAMAQLAKENNEIYRSTGIRLTSKNPEMRKIEFTQALKGKQKEELEKSKLENRMKSIAEVRKGRGNFENNDQQPQEEQDPFREAEEFAVIGEHDLSQIASKKAETKIKQQQKHLSDLRTETIPIRKEISDRAQIARRSIQNKQDLISLIDTGKLDDPTYATILENLPLKFGQRFLSPETVQYKAGLVQGYNDLRNIFTGATRVKEIEILENKIADLYLTDDQKKAILKSSMLANQADIIREEAAAELEGKPLSLLQYNKEVEKVAKPRMDALFNRIIDEQNAIIKDAENRRAIPLDPSDPEDFKIMQQIKFEAGGDKAKAKEIAKKKGYTVKGAR